MYIVLSSENPLYIRYIVKNTPGRSVGLLLAARADPTWPDEEGCDALACAAAASHPGALAALLAPEALETMRARAQERIRRNQAPQPTPF